jgi:hypothetical protein
MRFGMLYVLKTLTAMDLLLALHFVLQVLQMLTLEIHGKFITWPEDFAVLMMKYYRDNGISFIVHGNCSHTEYKTTGSSHFLSQLALSDEFQGLTFCCSSQVPR